MLYNGDLCPKTRPDVVVAENGLVMYLWIGINVSRDWLQGVFGVQSAAQVDIDKVGTVSHTAAQQLYAESHHLDGWWMGKNEGAKKVFQNHRYCKLCFENGCHSVMCVCSFFLVIKHISTGLYVYELTSTCPPNKFDWQKFVS